MEIRVGEYIRTKDGYIRKIIEDISTDNSYFKLDKEKLTKYEFTYFYSDEIFKKEIKNHSFNIKDLIEEGDYLNGIEVVTIDGYDEDGNDKEELGILETYVDEVDGIYLTDVNIRTIVTKEQFKAKEYEVK